MEKMNLIQTQAAHPHVRYFSMKSGSGDRNYRIYVACPFAEPPADGYPVIYVLDANAVIYTIVEALCIQARRPEKTGVGPAVIVGIGYDTDEPFSPARHYDFTMEVPLEELPAHPEGRTWPRQGGADRFLRFIEEELRPVIEQKFPVNGDRQTLAGHSLGGLFVLYTLFTKPNLFRNYAAGSPSIHWNEGLLADLECKFAGSLPSRAGDIRVFIGVGELERRHPSRMNENAEALYERLRMLEGAGCYTEFHEFEDENHGSVLPVFMSRILRFGMR